MRALVLSGGAAHGAFQAGAIQALYEIGWIPEIICGSSVGAINAAGLASGKSPEHLCELWRKVTSRDVYRWRPPNQWLKFWKWSHVLDTTPLSKLLNKYVDFDELQHSPQTVTCFSVDVRTGHLQGYANRVTGLPPKFRRLYRPDLLDVDAVMSSTAIPLVFPWSRGEWDGSLLQYAPLKPAVLLGATEIVVVSLEIHEPEPALPTGVVQTALRILDISSMSRLRSDLRTLLARNNQDGYRNIDVRVIRPLRNLGYSKLNFNSPLKEAAIAHGRNCAHQIMSQDV